MSGGGGGAWRGRGARRRRAPPPPRGGPSVLNRPQRRSPVSENSTVMELSMELSQRLINLEFKIDLILRKLDEKPDRSELPRPAGQG